jgi:hypothetical protein
MTSTMPIGCRYNEPSRDTCIENFHIFDSESEEFQCKAGVANEAIQPNQRCSNGLQVCTRKLHSNTPRDFVTIHKEEKKVLNCQ